MCTLAVLVHAAVVLAHGAAHSTLRIALPAWGNFFVVFDILVGPLCGLLLLKLGRRRMGAAVIAITMTAALLFGVWNHFVVAGADHVAHLPDNAGKTTFQVTAWLLAATETFGSVIAIGLLRKVPQVADRG